MRQPDGTISKAIAAYSMATARKKMPYKKRININEKGTIAFSKTPIAFPKYSTSQRYIPQQPKESLVTLDKPMTIDTLVENTKNQNQKPRNDGTIYRHFPLNSNQ